MGWQCTACGEKAYIYSTRHLSKTFRQQYTICKNAECQQREVVDISHNRVLSPPISKPETPTQNLINLISQMPPDEVNKLLEQVQ